MFTICKKIVKKICKNVTKCKKYIIDIKTIDVNSSRQTIKRFFLVIYISVSCMFCGCELTVGDV